MADLRFNDKNNQKKEYSVFASGELDGENGTLFTLPQASYVTAVNVIATDGGTADGTVAGVSAGTYYPTGATVTVSGVVGKEKVIVEYIETELAEGTYTD